MKLRLRSIQSKETQKIEVPDSCTLPQLKQILIQRLSNSPPPASISLSLNRKDELPSGSEELLTSLGIASGDLIFFSFKEHVFGVSSNSQNTLPSGTESCPISSESKDSERSECLNSLNPLDSQKGETLGRSTQMEENPEYMVVEGESNEIGVGSDGISTEVVENSFSIPAFLRHVFTEELDNSGRDRELIVIAIHAVMLESGFVGFDWNANQLITGFRFHNNWPSNLSGMSLNYTLPETLNGKNGKDTKSVVLRFQSLQKFITVYGTLGSGTGKRGTHRVHLNEDQLIPFLNVVWANCGETEIMMETDEAITSPEKEVFKFWRSVKDNIALPLLIDLCEEAGLELPPCFMRLPTDLKLKILESISGVDLARVCCVCSELQYLGMKDDLWKLKFTEEFGDAKKDPHLSWKTAFVTLWNRRNRNAANRLRQSPFWPAQSWRRYPNPFMVSRVPRTIGGDYDLFPAPYGDDMHNRLLDSASNRRRKFSINCNLGFRSGRFV